MSEQHAKRIRQVGREIEAAVEILEKGAKYGSNNPMFFEADVQDLHRAARNAADTYYFRLVAEFEGMLFRHLRDHFDSFIFDPNGGARLLLNHSRTRLGIPDRARGYAALASEVEEVIEWRNFLVHGQRGANPSRVPLEDAENRVHDLVRLLPDMKDSR